MIEILRALQALFVLTWAVPIVLFAKQAWSKAGDNFDQLAAAMWYVSASVVAFPLRWLVQGAPIQVMPHDEMALWSVLYVMGIFAAAYMTIAVQNVCPRRG